MSDYDFHQLSPYDLEILARDLLQEHWGVAIESFKAGKDGGIDLRYAQGANKLIVQVKHFLKSGLSKLKSELNKEVRKVKQIQPTRYSIVTSVPLSAGNKNDIVKIIGADVLKPTDIFGQEDLNNLLGLYPKIEHQHYKLWLASRAVLDRVIHTATLTQSEFKVQQVHQEARRYVQSDAYPQAREMLDKHRVVVIAGPPGVGKTTLANLLLYEHLARKYQAVLIQRDIEEGQRLFQPGTPQIFYFDDFMGATFLGDRSSAFNGASDKALLDFIAMVRHNPTARLILTTREHIYSQAAERSERLRDSDLDDLRVFLRMPSYSFAQKASILYNHLYFSDLPVEYQDELLRDAFYLQIIKHEKFNPRLIEWLSSYRRLSKVPVTQYREFVDNLLRDPSEIWRHAYEQEITDAARSLLLSLFSLGGKAGGTTLKAAFNALHVYRSGQYGFSRRPEDFRSALREIEGTFIKPYSAHGIEVIDPSVLDLLNTVVRQATDNAIDLISGAATFDQIHRIWVFAKAPMNGSVLDALRECSDRLADSMADHMAKERRIDLGDGTIGKRGMTFESRLATVIDMAERLASAELAKLVGPLFERLQFEWRSERPDINDAIDLLRRLENARYVEPSHREDMQQQIKSALVADIKLGCRSDELREFISTIEISAPDGSSAFMAARDAFNIYTRSSFQDELRECRSREQFEELTEDLELFRDRLGVDISNLIAKLEESVAEYESMEDNYADYMHDQWKERWRDERADERQISEMFATLRDRN